MAGRKPKVEPVRRSLRLMLKSQNVALTQTRQTVARASDRKHDIEHLERARAKVRSSAKVKKATAVRTRIKGIPAQKRVNPRLSSSDSFMSGTTLTAPKPRAARTGHSKYRKQTLPKPPHARSSSSSNDSLPKRRSTVSEYRPRAGPSARQTPSSEKFCTVCGKQEDSRTPTLLDPRICSALSQAIVKIGPALELKGRLACMKCGISCPYEDGQ